MTTDRNDTAGALAHMALAASIERFLREEMTLRVAPDPDAIHDARVAVRRLRSDLRSFLPVLDHDWACALRERLRWLAEGLGAARDADVLLAALEARAADLPGVDRAVLEGVFAPLRAEREAAYRRVRTMLGEEQYAAVLSELVEALHGPPLGPRAGENARAVVPDLLDEAWKGLRKAVRRRSRPPSDAELHRIRIKAKRVRYGAEAATDLLGADARRLARAIERLQTVLGEQHDAVVAAQRLRRDGYTESVAFVAGELAVLSSESALAARRRWRRVWNKAKRRYRALRSCVSG